MKRMLILLLLTVTVDQRVFMIEFDSVAQAIAAHDSPGYQVALKAMGKDAVGREIRIVEGLA